MYSPVTSLYTGQAGLSGTMDPMTMGTVPMGPRSLRSVPRGTTGRSGDTQAAGGEDGDCSHDTDGEVSVDILKVIGARSAVISALAELCCVADKHGGVTVCPERGMIRALQVHFENDAQ